VLALLVLLVTAASRALGCKTAAAAVLTSARLQTAAAPAVLTSARLQTTTAAVVTSAQLQMTAVEVLALAKSRGVAAAVRVGGVEAAAVPGALGLRQHIRGSVRSKNSSSSRNPFFWTAMTIQKKSFGRIATDTSRCRGPMRLSMRHQQLLPVTFL
jgi:hypothetical protein